VSIIVTSDPGFFNLSCVSRVASFSASSVGCIMSGAKMPVDSSRSEFSTLDNPCWYAILVVRTIIWADSMAV